MEGQLINDSLGEFEKSLTLILLNLIHTSLHYNVDESYLCVNEIEVCKNKGHDDLTPYRFLLGWVSKDLAHNEMKEISLNGNVYNF